MEMENDQQNLVLKNESQRNSESHANSAHEQIIALLSTFYAVVGNPPEVLGALNGMAAALMEEGATVEQVAAALRQCRRVKFPVRLPHILENLPQHGTDDGRPGVELAWAMCPRSEEVSVVWTAEMAEAFGMSRALLMHGDEIGARMVFKEQYPQLVSRSRAEQAPIKWIVSLGWDAADRVRALSEAIEKKRITAAHAYGLLGPVQQDELLSQLPVPERKMLTGDVKPNQRMLSGFQKSLAVIRESTTMPELQTEPRPEKVKLTEAEMLDRREMLRQQLHTLRAKYNG